MSRRRSGLKIGLAQIRIAMGNGDANRDEILRYVSLAGRARCDVVAFPECCLAGWLSAQTRSYAEPVPNGMTRRLARQAKRYGMAIVLGMEERAGDHLYNSAVLIDRSGKILLHHRKINELDIGLQLYTRGTSLNVAVLKGRTVSLSICADSWTPEVTDALYFMGARLIFSPCAWAVEPGGEATNLAWIRETYRARTKGRDLFIVSPNSVGRMTDDALDWKGRVLHGNSLVTGPDGETLLRGPSNEPALLTLRI